MVLSSAQADEMFGYAGQNISQLNSFFFFYFERNLTMTSDAVSDTAKRRSYS